MSNIIHLKRKYPLMPAVESLNLTASQLRTLANSLEELHHMDKAGDIREAAYFIGKVARELEK